ncbi:MAG: hypothetical protein ABR599_09865 [Gemmatimonadota bacterium]
MRWEAGASELRGYAAAARGNLDAAIRELEGADAMARDLAGGPSPMGRYHLATLLIRQWRPREAQRCLENWSPYWWPVSTLVELRLEPFTKGSATCRLPDGITSDSCEPGRDPIRSCDRCWRRVAPPSSG